MKIKHKKWIAIISSFILIVTFVVAGVSGVGDNLLIQVDENSNQEGIYETIEEEIPEEGPNNYQARIGGSTLAYLGIYYYDGSMVDAGSNEGPEVSEYFPVANESHTYGEWMQWVETETGSDDIREGIESPGTGYWFDGWYYYNGGVVSAEKVDLSQTIVDDTNHHADGTLNDLPYVEIIEVWSNEYEVTLHNNGEGTIDTETIKVKYGETYSALGDVTVTPQEGRTLAGWSYTEGGTTVDVNPGTTVTKEGNHDLYAVWVDDAYNLVFNYNYPGSPNQVTVEWGNFDNTDTYAEVMAANGIPENPTIEGYTFTGWYTSATGGTMVDLSTTVSQSNRELYAHWQEKTYTISYEINGEVYEGSPNSYKYTTESVTLPSPERDGYVFYGWYTNSDFSGDPISEFKPGSEKKDIKFYGRYLTAEQDELYTMVVNIEEHSNTMTSLELFNAKVSAVVYYEQKLSENSGFTIGEYYDNIIKEYKNDIEYSNHNSSVDGLVLEGINKWFVRLDVEELSELSADFQSIASQIDADVIIKLYDINLIDVSSVADQMDWTIYNLEAGETAIIKIPQSLFDASGYENIRLIHQDSKTSEIENLDYEIQDGYYVIELSSFSPVGIIADIIEQPVPGAADDGSGMGTDADVNADTGAAVGASGKNASGGYTQTGDSLPIFEIAIFAIAGIAILLVVIVKHKRFTH